MRNVSDKGCTESQNTKSTISNLPPPPPPPLKSCRLWDKVEKCCQSEWPQKTIWRMRISRWIPKATNTHTHTLRICNIYYFSQQWLHECASCYVKRTLAVLFITSLCTNTHTVIDTAKHKESNLPNYSSYVVLRSKQLHGLRTSQGVPKFRPISVFHHNNKCMQLNSTNYDVAHYTTAY
jgi:hypothetical protein